MWYSKPGAKALLVVAIAVLAGSGVARTHRRNADWRDRATLLRTDIVTMPQNAKLHYNLANYLRETEQQDGAIKHYKEALRLWPTYSSAHNNIGTLVGGTENAEHHFLQAIKYNKHHVNAHYNLGKLYKKNGRTSKAIKMLERCIQLRPQFVQAHAELLTLIPELERRKVLTRLVQLEPSNWEHYVLYGNWLRDRDFYGAALKFYLEATRLTFKNRNVESLIRGDLISFRSAALTLRKLGQKSRTLQLLTRWQTWRRGWPSTAAAHMYLRDWRLKIELEGRIQIYSKAVNPIKSTKCFDHTRLIAEVGPASEDAVRYGKELTAHTSFPREIDEKIVKRERRTEITTSGSCDVKGIKHKRRGVSVNSQIKTTHNKSEIGLKGKKCSAHRKEKNTKDNIMPKFTAPLVEHILKTF